jgi:hypothetical protein
LLVERFGGKIKFQENFYEKKWRQNLVGDRNSDPSIDAFELNQREREGTFFC